MERITRVRARALLLFFVVIVALYAFHLYDLQIIETGGQTDNATVFVTQTSVKAARGEILDRNGNVLVGNRAGYKLMLNHFVIFSADGTYDHLYRLAMRCRDENISYNENFPISRERPFTYTLEEYTSAQKRYFQAFLYGAPLSAARDAVLVFYEVNRDKTGTIQEIDFCFVARDIFEQVYRICE